MDQFNNSTNQMSFFIGTKQKKIRKIQAIREKELMQLKQLKALTNFLSAKGIK